MSVAHSQVNLDEDRGNTGTEALRSLISDRLIGQRQKIFADLCVEGVCAHDLKQKGCHKDPAAYLAALEEILRKTQGSV